MLQREAKQEEEAQIRHGGATAALHCAFKRNGSARHCWSEQKNSVVLGVADSLVAQSEGLGGLECVWV